MPFNIPNKKPHDWISVEGVNCVICQRLKIESSDKLASKFGHYEVVFDPKKPTNRNVFWDGSAWHWCEAGDYGGYADKYPRLKPYVDTLKNG
jgi:hypothetical protein